MPREYQAGVSMDGRQFTITDTTHDELMCIVKFQDDFARLTLHDKARWLKWLADAVLTDPDWKDRVGPVYEPTPAADAVAGQVD